MSCGSTVNCCRPCTCKETKQTVFINQPSSNMFLKTESIKQIEIKIVLLFFKIFKLPINFGQNKTDKTRLYNYHLQIKYLEHITRAPIGQWMGKEELMLETKGTHFYSCFVETLQNIYWSLLTLQNL